MKSFVSLGVAAFLILGLAYFATAQAEEGKTAAKAAEAKGHTFVGTPGCKMCHAGATKGAIYETWEKSKHSQAFANLPAESKKDAKCFACHTTGNGKAGGYDPASPIAAKLEGVGCEACHGPGSDYKAMSVMKDKAKAKECGLIMPTETTCKGCHEGVVPEGHKALPKFEFAASAKLIEHKLPAKK